jgi:hypothetical protein
VSPTGIETRVPGETLTLAIGEAAAVGGAGVGGACTCSASSTEVTSSMRWYPVSVI